ncbi:MAG TPA: hypothetical protein VGM25_14970 [Caulobacteraceae bacterium]
MDRAAAKTALGRLTACALLCALLCAALVAPTAHAQVAPYTGVTIEPGVQARLGVRTAVLKSERRQAQVDAFAKVLDPGPLAQLETDLEGAVASAAASAAEARRAKALNASGGAVASKDAEAAEAQARNDATKVDLLRQRIGLEWGPGLQRLNDARRRALIKELSNGQAALVHVDSPNNAGQAQARSVEIDVADVSVHGEILGAARAAEPRLQSSGLIAVARGKSAILLSNGLIQSAHINTPASAPGVTIPRAAVIRFNGSDWAYVRHGPQGFERRRLDSPTPSEAGLFVTRGFSAGDEVVVQGAAELFGVEQNLGARPR